jgi:tight adherence protein C
MSATAGLMPWVLGAAWGVIVAGPFVRSGRRVVATSRATTLASSDQRAARAVPSRLALPSPVWLSSFLGWVRTGPIGRVLGSVVRRRRSVADDAQLGRELPVVIDLLGVAVGSGCTPFLAVEVAARWSPPVAATRFDGVLRACAMGMSFDAALAESARDAPRLRPLSDALLASERLGAPVGPVLARLAAEERTALRRRAEAHARRVPVRLLFPLVFLVLPAFVLLTVVPGLAAGLQRL